MNAAEQIRSYAVQAIKALYSVDITGKDIQINQTKPEFEGDYTIVLFPFVKQLRKSPDALGQEIGNRIVEQAAGNITGFNVIKGFLNLSLAHAFWIQFLQENYASTSFGSQPANGKRVMIEYSSPNTNKPLHLGHLRNNFLGWSVAQLYKAGGYEVFKTCIVNDRGIHICKSMLAWQKFGDGATPATTGQKGDHLVGDFYVQFEHALKEEAAPIIAQLEAGEPVPGMSDTNVTKAKLLADKLQQGNLPAEKQDEIKAELKELARNATPLMAEVRDMLLKWEEGDEETLRIWNMMNGWVYAGFDETYKRIGSDFDKIYYESGTYLLGKEYVNEGLEKGIFFRKADGSVWIDLTGDGLDEKLVLRKDGTSVYITQDIGLAKLKYDEFKIDESIYVIGDEQNYHMKVLQLICKKLGMPYADAIHHLSYGMVELPSGRMKSREGTVVDADDLCDEMEKVAEAKTTELGKVKDFSETELKHLYHILGLGALKFYLLRVDPKKKMVFNPEESIDFHGFTGPFVQYTHARIKSVLRKAEFEPGTTSIAADTLLPLEKEVTVLLEQFPETINQAIKEMNPSLVATYVFNLAKTFNSFYTEHSIAGAESAAKRNLRLAISNLTANVIYAGMRLLGIFVPDRM